MAPHGKGSDDAVEAMVTQVEKHAISSILIIIAMQTEALPLVNKFQLAFFIFERGLLGLLSWHYWWL